MATSHGAVAVVDSGAQAPAVLLLHGNSMSSQAFAGQLQSSLSERYRLIAFDFPGHGASPDACDPERSYCVPGYADAALDVLESLGVDTGAVLGWSLGGHVGLELMARWNGLQGLMVVGTPPIEPSPAALAEAFLPTPMMAFAGQRDATPSEAEAYARACCGSAVERMPALLDAVRRADGRARQCMMASVLTGEGVDGRRIAETCPTPLAVVVGADDPFVSKQFLVTLDYACLWRETVHVMEGCGHAPFLDNPFEFNALLGAFLSEVLR